MDRIKSIFQHHPAGNISSSEEAKDQGDWKKRVVHGNLQLKTLMDAYQEFLDSHHDMIKKQKKINELLLNFAEGNGIVKKTKVDVESIIQSSTKALVAHKDLIQSNVKGFIKDFRKLQKKSEPLRKLSKTKRLLDATVASAKQQMQSKGTTKMKGKGIISVLMDERGEKKQSKIIRIREWELSKDTKILQSMITFYKTQIFLSQTTLALMDHKSARMEKLDDQLAKVQSKVLEEILDEKILLQNSLQTAMAFVDDRRFMAMSQYFLHRKSMHRLLPEERILHTSLNAIVVIFQSWIAGSFFVTNYRLKFVANGKVDKDGTNIERQKDLFTVFLPALLNLSYIGGQNEILLLQFKDLRTYTISLKYSDVKGKEIVESITTHQWSIPAMTCKKHREKNGWEIYDPLAEYNRIGFPDDDFRICYLNHGFKLCSSYPEIVVIPKTIKDLQLAQAATFRRKRRFISICWKHPQKKGLILARCSQPTVGIMRSRNQLDESFFLELHRISCKNKAKLDQPENVLICDSRPIANAMANVARGGGWENHDFYPKTEIVFQNIANIHVVRDSLSNLQAFFREEMQNQKISEHMDIEKWAERYIGILEALRAGSGKMSWFSHLSKILTGSLEAAIFIKEGRGSVVAHCSDGWDRTSQVCSLVEILLDPYYRSIEGLCVLVEKEWLSFGHKIARRSGHESEFRDPFDKQKSPIFIQWLDCVFQIMNQYQSEFEYSTAVLVLLAEELYNCRFGTFLFNCRKDRVEHKLEEETESIWSYIYAELKNYQNPFYKPTGKFLDPDCDQAKLQLWLHYYKRWDFASLRDKNSFDAASILTKFDQKYSATNRSRRGTRRSLSQSNIDVNQISIDGLSSDLQLVDQPDENTDDEEEIDPERKYESENELFTELGFDVEYFQHVRRNARDGNVS